MAKKGKTIKIKGSKTIKLNAKSKERTYVIDENAANTAVITISSPFDNSIVMPASKDSDDLCLLTIVGVGKNELSYKFAKTIIKDYYKYAVTNPNLVKEDGESIYQEAKRVKDNGGYLAKGTVNGAVSELYGDKKNTIYKINEIVATEDGAEIEDFGGNDKYTISAPYNAAEKNDLTIADLKGNDNYTVKNGAHVSVSDSSGKDRYTITDSTIVIEDFFGKDRYISTNGITEINDYTGKDYYNINGNKTSQLLDVSGKDRYIIKNAEDISVKDGITKAEAEEDGMERFINKSGKDNYTISNTTQLTLDDMAGNDKYSLTDVSTATKEGNFNPD